MLVDKPIGWTSFDVVAKLRAILRPSHKGIKIGHTGTLDPAATGLLIIVIGSHTKRADWFKQLPKTYQAEVTLGATSSTGDSEGEIQLVDHSPPTQAAVNATSQALTGELLQVPPVYSAIKIKGQRAYRLARAGRHVKMPARQVTIYGIDQLHYVYPKLSFVCKVSSGTYIRSLATDFGSELKTGGYLSALRRLKIGDWSLQQALAVNSLTPTTVKQALQRLTG